MKGQVKNLEKDLEENSEELQKTIHAVNELQEIKETAEECQVECVTLDERITEEIEEREKVEKGIIMKLKEQDEEINKMLNEMNKPTNVAGMRFVNSGVRTNIEPSRQELRRRRTVVVGGFEGDSKRELVMKGVDKIAKTMENVEDKYVLGAVRTTVGFIRFTTEEAKTKFMMKYREDKLKYELNKDDEESGRRMHRSESVAGAHTGGEA